MYVIIFHCETFARAAFVSGAPFKFITEFSVKLERDTEQGGYGNLTRPVAATEHNRDNIRLLLQFLETRASPCCIQLTMLPFRNAKCDPQPAQTRHPHTDESATNAPASPVFPKWPRKPSSTLLPNKPALLLPALRPTHPLSFPLLYQKSPSDTLLWLPD